METLITGINPYNKDAVIQLLTERGYMHVRYVERLPVTDVCVFPEIMAFLPALNPNKDNYDMHITADAFIHKYSKPSFRSKSGYTLTKPQQDYNQHEMDTIRRDFEQSTDMDRHLQLPNGEYFN